MEKKRAGAVMSIIISAVVALLALWGYNVVVVQPVAEQVEQNTADLYGVAAHGWTGGLIPEELGSRGVGDTNVTNLVVSGTVTAGGAVTGASLDVAPGGVAWGDVSKSGSSLNDLATMSTAKSVTVGSLTVNGTCTGCGGAASITRSIPLPLTEWFDCTASPPARLAFTDGTDRKPYLFKWDSIFGIQFDATTGSEDTDAICTTLIVPPDYVSDGKLRYRLSKEDDVSTNSEKLDASFYAELGDETQCLTSAIAGTAAQTVIPADCSLTLTTGTAQGIKVKLVSDDTAIDDTMDIYGISFVYTATQ